MIVSELANDKHLGRTKLAKVFYLADTSLRLNLQTQYYREAAGPLDARALYNEKVGIEPLAHKRGYFTAQDKRRTIRYVPHAALPTVVNNAPSVFGEKWSGIQQIIALCRPLSTERCEIVATLYACWNDLLLERKPVTDELIVREFLMKWDEKKRRFSKQRLFNALAWMKQKGLVARGAGKHTNIRGAGSASPVSE